MPPKETIVINEEDKEVASFLVKLRSAGQLRVQIGDDVFSVKVSSERVSDHGRAYLTKTAATDD
jgi:hypothetical protein